ncbi:MAG: GAF domain-containing protein [candidate division WOR-3 bacterium]
MKAFKNFPLLLIENIPYPLIVFDADGKLIYVNEKGDRFIKENFLNDYEKLKNFLISIYYEKEGEEVNKIRNSYSFEVIDLVDNTKVFFVKSKKPSLLYEDVLNFFSEVRQVDNINLLLQKFCDFILNETGAGKVTIFLYDEKLGVYKRLALSTREPFKKEEFKKNIFKIGEGITGKVIETGVTFYAPDVDEIKEYYRSSASEKSELIIPIKDKQMVYGTIGIGSEKKDAFDEIDIRFLEKIANFLTFIIKNLYIYKDLEMERKEIEVASFLLKNIENTSLRESFEKFVQIMGKSFDFKGFGINYDNLSIWYGEGKEGFNRVLKENPEKILERYFSDNLLYFYVIPFKKINGYVVIVVDEILSEKERESLDKKIEFTENILLTVTRRSISLLHKELMSILLKHFSEGSDTILFYKDIGEILTRTFSSDRVLIMEKKNEEWEIVFSFPYTSGDIPLEEIPLTEEISEKHIVITLEESPQEILYILHPKEILPIFFIKEFLKTYFKIIKKLEKYNKNISLFQTLKKLLETEVRAFSLKEYLDDVCKIIKENLGYSFVGVLLKEDEYLKLISSSGYEKYKDLNIKLKIGEEGLSGIAFRKGETIYSPDVTRNPFYFKVSESIKSEVAIPLQTEKERLGVLVVSSQKTHGFSQEDILFLEDLANQISFFIQDIIEKEEKNEMLTFLEEEMKFSEMVLRNIPIGIAVTDAEFNIKRVNDGFALLLKKEPKELIGRRICNFLCTHEEGGFCKIENSFINRRPLFKEKFTVSVGGEAIPLAVTSSFVYGKEDIIKGIILIVEDIREIAKLEEQLRRTERLSAMGKIAAYMAHEIKNPLASISTGIEFISHRLPAENSVKGYIDMILKEIYRLDRLIKNLLSFASRKPVRKIAVNIVDILKECVLLLAPETIGKDIEIRENFEESELIVHLDPDQFKEIIFNLVRNSIEAIEKEGEIELGFRRIGNNVVLWCKDNGKGIKEEYLPHIFEPFFSTKKGGSGLGLAIVHKIIEEHGGKVEVESEHEKGTIFKIYLPL